MNASADNVVSPAVAEVNSLVDKGLRALDEFLKLDQEQIDFIDQHCNQMKVPTSYRNLRIDVENHMVYRGEEVIDLTRREYDLLATLMGSKHVLSREQLLERVWKYESTAETNIVDVYIRYLRGKIDLPGQKSYIKTVRGVGYQMQE